MTVYSLPTVKPLVGGDESGCGLPPGLRVGIEKSLTFRQTHTIVRWQLIPVQN